MSKALKVVNVLKYKIILEQESFDLNVVIQQMNRAFGSKGVFIIKFKTWKLLLLSA